MNFLSIVLLFGMFQGILLATVLSVNRIKKISHLFLITLLVLSSGFLFYQYLVFERFLETWPHLTGAFLPLLYLLPPLFWFYIKNEAGTGFSISRSDYYHWIPFVLSLFIMIPFYLSPENQKFAALMSHRSSGELYPFRSFLILGVWISGLIYGIKSFLHISKSGSIKKRWLRSFVNVFLLLTVCFFIALALNYTGSLHHREIMIGASTLFSLFIHFIGYSALRKSSLVSGGKNSSIAKMDQAEKKQLKERVVAVLEKERAYQRSDFSMKELSDLLAVNSNYLSALINDEFNCNFTFLVNSYRITDAEEMIKSDEFSHLNFLGIGTAVGFSNKNSFTRAFKRHKGQTPSEFKSGLQKT